MEVRASLNRHLVTLLSKQSAFQVNPLIGQLYSSLAEKNIDQFVSTLRLILSDIPYSLHIPEERFYHSLLQTLCSAAGIDVHSERMTSIGRMDLSLEFPHIIYVIELKLNASAQKGLEQILEKKYYEPFLKKNKPICAVGLSFQKTDGLFQIESAIKPIS